MQFISSRLNKQKANNLKKMVKKAKTNKELKQHLRKLKNSIARRYIYTLTKNLLLKDNKIFWLLQLFPTLTTYLT